MTQEPANVQPGCNLPDLRYVHIDRNTDGLSGCAGAPDNLLVGPSGDLHTILQSSSSEACAAATTRSRMPPPSPSGGLLGPIDTGVDASNDRRHQVQSPHVVVSSRSIPQVSTKGIDAWAPPRRAVGGRFKGQ